MRADTHDLARILNRQNELLQKAVGYSEEKREAVIRGDVEKLNSLVSLETACIEELERSENARMQYVETLARLLGLDGQDTTLETLCTRLNDSDGKMLLEMHAQLKAAVSTLTQSNRLNARLIALQLSQISIMINTLTEPLGNMYTGQGTMEEKPGKKQGVFDFTV